MCRTKRNKTENLDQPPTLPCLPTFHLPQDTLSQFSLTGREKNQSQQRLKIQLKAIHTFDRAKPLSILSSDIVVLLFGRNPALRPNGSKQREPTIMESKAKTETNHIRQLA